MLRGPRILRAFLSALAVLLCVAGPAWATARGGRSDERALTEAANGNYEMLESADQYAEARTSPADSVDAGAFTAAYQSALTLPITGGAWSELTTKPYNSDDPGYRDPVWSNSGGGSGNVSGRATALAASGNAVYAGTADGGVWKSTNNGSTWTPLLDDSPSMAIGALAVDPATGALWVGTGEGNTSSDGYAGSGVLMSSDGGAHFTRVGGTELENHLTERLTFDGQGNVYAATSKGLYKHSAAGGSSAWTLLLAPCTAQHDTTYISDVVVRPNTGGQDVTAVIGWRGGSACNGFYHSTDGGKTFQRTAVTGAINDRQIGRTTLAYSADGKKLYAVVQSSDLFNHPKTDLGGTLLMGVFVSPTGNPAGSWNKIAEWRKLQQSGSALNGTGSKGYRPGVQAWYNQFLTVDPNNSNHVYLGLEEVYETTDGGTSWKTIGPYWNFGLPCATQSLDNCAPTTHSDQHGAMIANGRLFVANDGGVYSRPVSNATSWTNLNAGLRSLQYYYAGLGKTAGGDAAWGGLQDNGESLLKPGASTMVSPFGGDGGDTLVDPNNADKAVVEYVDLDMALTTNGGRSDGTTKAFREISPSCFAYTYTPSPCDPSPRFIAPFRADIKDINHWVAGGEFVWDNQGKGWDTSCSSTACDWKQVYDAGPGASVTALADSGATTYAAWCGPCNAPTFSRGLATNAGGTWHTITGSNLPNRYVNALTVDPADPNHVYAVFNGFSRRWTNDGGYGHVYESKDAGATWTDISNNLPDIPGDDLVIAKGRLVYATDLGVYTALPGGGAATSWSRMGSALPNASVNDLTVSPDGNSVVAATHGRGLWKLTLP